MCSQCWFTPKIFIIQTYRKQVNNVTKVCVVFVLFAGNFHGHSYYLDQRHQKFVRLSE